MFIKLTTTYVEGSLPLILKIDTINYVKRDMRPEVQTKSVVFTTHGEYRVIEDVEAIAQKLGVPI